MVSSESCVAVNCLRLSKYGASREVNLKGTKSATLSFSYRRQLNIFTSSKVNLQVSADAGANWMTLATYAFDGSDRAPIAQSFDLTPYRAANTQVRFLVDGYLNGYFYVDDVQIEYTHPGSEALKNTGAEQTEE